MHAYVVLVCACAHVHTHICMYIKHVEVAAKQVSWFPYELQKK